MRVNRLLSILLIISKKGIVTGHELAEHFEVSLRTIYRDIEKIGEAGIPVASSGGKGGGYYLINNYSIDNLFLNREEIKVLMPIMDNLQFLFGKNEQFNDIVLKLENMYKREKKEYDRLSINMSHFSMEAELKEYLYLIYKAIEESKLLEFEYINRRMENSLRTVEPIHISFKYGEWFLTAFCRNRGDYRQFKLLRMRNIRVSDNFTRRNASMEEIESVIKNSYSKRSIMVKLKFSDRMGKHLAEYFSKDKIKPLVDGRYIVEEYFPYEEGLVKFIIGLGKDCEVLEPEYLRREISEYLGQIILKYK